MEPLIETTTPVLYRWTDEETGEVLCILVQGPPEFLAELRADGFRPVEKDSSVEGQSRCVVVATA